ncbi:Dihydrodipicolinate synthase [Arcobacter nitrofigilis DSM 7299]|uniref:Dihydrodipicolinate synthase n=1 Tax=Arcobacter nitrofigilis (strain ATCC 33309 / DSM 7299 / CCUG 15893 / LMG 7604 / NCTC 12251 / CI) TaxID=572480 RepID=D5V3A6_ARCNC|nr:dihydrodipicolinate synthase family protein [Arcobacter nitrofigilis]ADG92688.1 Dihydrodipicolinate synthase [Arcobacter nitrofigilis DSM 7299]
MNTDFIHGVIPPIVTPTTSDDKVNESCLGEIVDHIIAGGVHGILSLGSNGEFYGLEREEQEKAATITIEKAAGRVPVYLGIADITTRECVRWAKQAESMGAKAVSVLHPMFLGPNDDEMYQHFKSVAEATNLPVLLYNNPDRMRCGISASLAERLSDIPNIVGIKESSGDMTLTAELIRRTKGKDFKVIAGRDILILSTLVYGGVGTVASSANIIPELVVDIYNKFKAGDIAGALEVQYKIAPMRMAYNLSSFPVVTKDYMRILGFDVGEPILPNTRSNTQDMAKLKALLDDLGAKKLV